MLKLKKKKERARTMPVVLTHSSQQGLGLVCGGDNQLWCIFGVGREEHLVNIQYPSSIHLPSQYPDGMYLLHTLGITSIQPLATNTPPSTQPPPSVAEKCLHIYRGT